MMTFSVPSSVPTMFYHYDHSKTLKNSEWILQCCIRAVQKQIIGILQLILKQLFDALELGIHVVKHHVCPNSSELLTQTFFVARGISHGQDIHTKALCGLHVMVVARFPHAKATSVCSS